MSWLFAQPVTARLLLPVVSATVLAGMLAIGLLWPSSSFEVELLLWIRENMGTSLNGLMQSMDVVGDIGSMSMALLGMALLVGFRRRFRQAAAVLITGVAAILVNIGLKVLVGRPRPGLWVSEVDSSYSLPSGHVLLFAVFSLLAYELWASGRWRMPVAVVGLLLVGLMGFSRLYLGEHYLSDVVASYAIAVLAWAGYRRIVGPADLPSPWQLKTTLGTTDV